MYYDCSMIQKWLFERGIFLDWVNQFYSIDTKSRERFAERERENEKIFVSLRLRINSETKFFILVARVHRSRYIQRLLAWILSFYSWENTQFTVKVSGNAATTQLFSLMRGGRGCKKPTMKRRASRRV